MFKEFLTLTFKGIRYRPMRSWLTVIGIIIGIMLVVIILSLSGGLRNIINQQLQMFGSDLLIILPGKDTNIVIGMVGGEKFAYSDIVDLEKLPSVQFAMPIDGGTLNAEFEGEKKAAFVHSSRLDRMRPVFEASRGVKMSDGSWATDENGNEVMLGYLAANDLFKTKVRVGDEIIVQSKRLRVVGIFEKMGEQTDDSSFYMSWNLYHLISGTKPGAMTALVKIRPGENIDLVARQVQFQLQKQKEVNEFTILTPARTTAIVGTIVGAVELALVIIALVSLLVGAVGIMNTMYTSVLERTKQIGIMKAVGASRDAIMSLFLIESGIIGFVGGFFGVVLGLAMSYLIGLAAASQGAPGLFSFATIDYFELFVIMVITFITGVVSGVLPARAAARLEPAEALRYE
ncbi:MAG: ABC transporter permease [Candidatus Pacebacteria bacterium]|nr:ABC transporter permease [Candidatus Paceibacterota bacterium]